MAALNRSRGAASIRRAYRRGAPLLAALLLAACADSRLALVTPDRTGLHVEARGEGARTLVVPLAARFGPYLETPPAANCRLLLYDPRARGRSDLSRFHRVGLREDVQDLEFLRRELGLDRFVLVGWWYTGAVAAHYALRHPERVEALILIAPLPLTRWPYVPDTDVAMLARAGAAELAAMEERARSAEGETEAFCRELYAATLRLLLHDPDLAATADASFCACSNERAGSMAKLMAEIFGKLGDWDWSSRLRELPVPTLIVHGASDPTPLASAEEWVATLPRARLVVIENLGRVPWVEAAPELNAAIARFLDEVADP